MTLIAQALSAALLHFVWQGLLVALLLWIALAVLKNRSANSRYLASSAALAALALLPASTTWILYRQPGPMRAAATFAAAAWPAAAALPRPAGAPVAWLSILQSWALPLWVAGVFVFSLRLAWGCRQVAALRHAGEAASQETLAMAATLRAKLGLFRQVSIVITSQSDGPSVVGWLRPAILLPAATLLGLTGQQLEAVLAHEFAHIRRHDYLVNLLQNLVETLLFYHPAVWWTSARMRHERELCCDDLAVRSCGDAICYARALTVLEKLRGASVSLAMGSTGGSLLYRIQRLMGLRPRETAPSRVPAIVALLVGIACLALNLNWARAQQREVPGVQVDLDGATVRERTAVEYPGYAWERKIGGIVVVEATLDGDGNVSDARILSGPAELRKAALQSVLEWHFAPAPAGSTRQISINFQWEQAQKAREGAETKAVLLNGRAFAFTVPADKQAELTSQIFEDALRHNYADSADQEVRVEPERTTEPSIVVSRIDIAGLTDLQQKQLAERLPRLGDSVTREQARAIGKMVSTFDPPVGLTFSLDANKQLVIGISLYRPR